MVTKSEIDEISNFQASSLSGFSNNKQMPLRAQPLPIKQIKDQRISKNISFTTALPVPMTNFEMQAGQHDINGYVTQNLRPTPMLQGKKM